MNHLRFYPPSGPAWTPAELAAARRRIDSHYAGAETGEEADWSSKGWHDWWLDVEATFGVENYGAACRLLNGEMGP